MKFKGEGTLIDIPDFYRSEFDCKCGCGFNVIEDTFVLKLQLTRTEAGFAFVLKSGCRCEKHNKEEGGTGTSDHLSGEGVDIKVTGGWQRLRIVDAALKNGFKRIGVASSFIHLGNNLRQNPAGLWTYKK